MDAQSRSSQAQFAAEILADRAAFLGEVLRRTDEKRRDKFAVVLDDLIRWSQGQPGALLFSRRTADRSQFFVTYDLIREPGHTFWQAYPHDEDGARLYVTGMKVLAPPSQKALFDGFAALSTGRKPKTDQTPTMAFGDLIWEPHRREVKRLLGDALASLGLPVEPIK